MKKLDSVKGVQALDARELQEIEGGILPAIAVGKAVLYLAGTVCALSR
ncbi:class IIb bacteriocin, lactobin A/cerein 7B family [Capnocytophaga canis]|nr:class IIb bacteriocin, lactobin A/cerein 7B family [Capnocytophaga canis]